MRNIFPAIQKSPRRRRAVAGVLIALLVGTLGLSITSTPAFAGNNGQQLQLYFPPKFNVHHVSVKGTNNYDKADAQTGFDYSSEYGWLMSGWYWKGFVTATVTLTYEGETFTTDVRIFVPKEDEVTEPDLREDWYITGVDLLGARVLAEGHFLPETAFAIQPRTITELAAQFGKTKSGTRDPKYP